MAANNSVNIVGRLGQDAEQKTSQNGHAIARFSVATDKVWKGEKKTSWHNCVLFGKRAEKLGQYLTKGTMVAVTGEIEYRKTDDGKTFVNIIVDDVTLLGGGKSGGQGGGPAKPPGPGYEGGLGHNPSDFTDDDIPY